MTGCLADLMEKANEMGLDECWDDVSDDDKAILEPMFRLKQITTFAQHSFPHGKENVTAKDKSRHLKVVCRKCCQTKYCQNCEHTSVQY